MNRNACLLRFCSQFQSILRRDSRRFAIYDNCQWHSRILRLKSLKNRTWNVAISLPRYTVGRKTLPKLNVTALSDVE